MLDKRQGSVFFSDTQKLTAHPGNAFTYLSETRDSFSFQLNITMRIFFYISLIWALTSTGNSNNTQIIQSLKLFQKLNSELGLGRTKIKRFVTINLHSLK